VLALAAAITSGRSRASTAVPAITFATCTMPLWAAGSLPWAVACQECSAVPMAWVAPRACTVGTFHDTSPTSVEPIIGRPLLSSGTMRSQSDASFGLMPTLRKEALMSSSLSVAWKSAALARSAASKGGGPRRSRLSCISRSSGRLPSRLDTAEITWLSTRVSVISAAPSATLRTRATRRLRSRTSAARMR
jgi:hypothetical protein